MATVVDMPKLSDTMTVGRLVKWLKKEGDEVKDGDMLAEVETDKATMELENFVKGTLLKQVVPAGSKVAIGSPICVIGQKGEAIPELKAPVATAPKAPEAPKAVLPPTPQPATPPPPAVSAHSVGTPQGEEFHAKASPLAKKIAEEHGLDLRFVKGTGPQGRITADDVQARLKLGIPVVSPVTGSCGCQAGPIAKAGETELSGMREAIAARLLQSKTTIPHFYIEIEVDATALNQLRTLLNKRYEAEGVKLTVNDFILKASTEALRAHPTMNASFAGDKIIQYGNVELAFGVAVEDGLVTPVIRSANTLSLKQISGTAKELVAKARSKKLTPNEMSGSTFTVTNLGMYGISRFYGIINPPNSAILAVGAARKMPIVDANGNIVVGERMTLALSCDHRVVDGALAAQFLGSMKELLEFPGLLLA